MGMAATKSQPEGEKYKRHRLKKSVPEGSFVNSHIPAKPNKITALLCAWKNHGLAVVNESCFLFLFVDVVKKHV
jgi:hypothetical protein